MDGKNSIYYEKYLKYKNKYLALKNKIGGNGHNRPCDTSNPYNQFYYNIFNHVKKYLGQRDPRYRFWTGHLLNHPTGCNLWVYREDFHNSQYPNHLDIYVVNMNTQSNIIEFGITAKVGGHPRFDSVKFQFIPNVPLGTPGSEEYLAQELTTKIDEMVHFIWG